MHLSTQNKQWLAERLLENNESHASHLQISNKRFPKIDLSEPISDDVLSMSCSDVAGDFNYNHERDKMYREWAQ